MTVFISPLPDRGGQFIRIKRVRKISFSKGKVHIHRLTKTESFLVGTSPKIESFGEKRKKAVCITATT